MENIVMSRPREEDGLDARKFPIMRALARFHECDAEALFSKVDASELEVHDLLKEMVSKKEVESSIQTSEGARRERFTLTLKGWATYMKILGSIYELPE